MDNGELPSPEDGQLTLSGAFSVSGSGGSISCPSTIKLQLESSTVEEEEPEGEIESFTVSKPSECDLSGGYKTTCGTNAVAKVTQTGHSDPDRDRRRRRSRRPDPRLRIQKCAIVSVRVEGNRH